MPDMIRSASLTGFDRVARAAGLDPWRLLREAGLDPACLQDPELRVRASAVGNLLERSARESGAEDFGLRLAAERNLSNLGPIGLLAREQPSVCHALESMGHYMRLHNESLSIRIERHGADAIVRLDFRVGEAGAARQASELAVAVLHRVLRLFLGQRWRAACVCFRHARPSRLDTHHALFGRTVEFDHSFDGIVCSAADIDAPITSSDPAMARTAKRYLDALLERPHGDADAIAREIVCMLLPAGRCSAERVAVHMGITRRTLDRRLARSGATFHDIVDEVRAELCMRYIDGRTRSMARIAGLLGFASQSSFSRWFRRRFGTSPSSHRAPRGTARG